MNFWFFWVKHRDWSSNYLCFNLVLQHTDSKWKRINRKKLMFLLIDMKAQNIKWILKILSCLFTVWAAIVNLYPSELWSLGQWGAIRNFIVSVFSPSFFSFWRLISPTICMQLLQFVFTLHFDIWHKAGVPNSNFMARPTFFLQTRGLKMKCFSPFIVCLSKK